MGTYIQVGVCIEASISKLALARAQITKEDAARRLPGELLDLTNFVLNEDADVMRWTLPKELVEEGLIPFLRAQYALFRNHAPQDAEAILGRIAEAGSYERIVALARTRSMPAFQASTMGEILSLGLHRDRLPVRRDMLVYVVAGKALIEDYTQFFAYVEELIHTQKDQFPIAAAVRVFLE
jgi:hypothetical protein